MKAAIHPGFGGFRLTQLISPQTGPAAGEPLALAVLAGEGIGPEVIAACRSILEVIDKHTAHTFEVEYGGKIGKEAQSESGSSLPPEILEFCRSNFERGAPILCGPGGGRFVYELRSEFDIYCKFVPLQPMPALSDTGVLREAAVRDVDILMIRENVGGVYQGSWTAENTENGRRAHQSFFYDEHQVQRIIALAVIAAKQRRGKLCVVHKPGGTPAISDLWVDIARQCTANSGVELRFLEVDTAAYLLLAEANSFDVVVTPNMFGDVLADAAALLLGSRGMSYSFNVSETGNSVYQTGHGAAYDLAGTNTANPIGQIQTLASLLHESFGLLDLSRALLVACNTVLAEGWRTSDIMTADARLLGTAEMGAAIAERLALFLKESRQFATTRQPG